jgi:serine/threonine protein kinase
MKEGAVMQVVHESNLTGSRISHYAIANLIGSGGMGQVYRGRDERLRRDVAIKVLASVVESRPHLRHRLIVEARALSRLSHPHVAGIYDFVTEAGRDFIIMEFVSGATLKSIVADGPLPLAEVIRLGRQMVRGLAAAHAAQVVHHDIKPGNLKVTSSGDLKILDFGLATAVPCRASAEISTESGSRFEPAGTLPYMAPEQLRGEVADGRSDIFSVGAVLYEMATGRLAFPQQQLAQLIEAILHQDPIPPSALNPFLPLAFERVVMKAMEKEPGERHQSAGELGDEIDGLTAAATRKPARASRLRDWVAALL